MPYYESSRAYRRSLTPPLPHHHHPPLILILILLILQHQNLFLEPLTDYNVLNINTGVI